MTRIKFEEASGVYSSMRKIEDYLNESSIDKRLLYLLKFRVSQINNCAYCLDMHYKEAIAKGEDPLRLYSVSAWKEAPYYTEKERAALRFAEELTLVSSSEFSESNFELLNQYFTKQEIGDLTLAIAQINSWNRIVRAFNPEPGKFKVKEETHSV